MDAASWSTEFDWSAPAGQMLHKLAAILPTERPFTITVFGSAPLQITIDRNLLSNDVDIFSDAEEVEEHVQRAGLSQGQSDFFIQVCSDLNFRTSPRWGTRTREVRIRNCTFVFPHPIDILIAKLNRLEEKDLEAFRVVLRKTGHPTEQELIRELQFAVDLFRPGFDEEISGDIASNTARLRPLLYEHRIDVRKEIISPALQKRREGYGLPARDYKRELEG